MSRDAPHIRCDQKGATSLNSKPISAITAFIKSESTAGLLLMAAAALALVIANSPWASVYDGMLNVHVGSMSILHVINDGFMAVFFLLVGLEIKREVVDGELSTRAK